MRIWIKNSEGKQDSMLTFALLGFLLVFIKVLGAGLAITIIGKKTLVLGGIDASSIAAILSPTLGAYVARRYTDKKYDYSAPDALAQATGTKEG